MIEKGYYILDEQDHKLADAEMVAFGNDSMTLAVTSEDDLRKVAGRKVLRFSIARVYAEVNEGQVVLEDGNRFSLENIENLSVKQRSEFKIQARFVSRITPILPRFIENMQEDAGVENNSEKKEDDNFRIPVEQEVMVRDISCGGIGFYSDSECSTALDYTIEIKITEQPLVVEVSVVRSEYEGLTRKYVNGAKFVNLRYTEERMLRQTIMRMQVLERKALKERLERIEEPDDEN